MKGKLIVIEGTDGCGKATQSGFLLKSLKKHGQNAVLVSFPRYNSFFGKLVKQYLAGKFGGKEKAPLELTALLFTLDRYAFKPELEKMLAKEKTVVCNRYSYSNFAHITARIKSPSSRKKFLAWIKTVESRLPAPDLKILLDMPVWATGKLLRHRAKKKKEKADLHERDAAYLEATRKVYLQIAKSEKNWVRIKCAKGRKILFPSEISRIIWEKAKSKI